MEKYTAQNIVDATKDIQSIVTGGVSAKYGRERTKARLASMHDRHAAGLFCCAVLDEMKKSGACGVSVVGEKITTVIVAGVSHETKAKVKNDTTSNAKSALASCLNQAYSGYADTFSIVSHKTDASLPKYTAKKVVDKVQVALDNLLDLLDCSPVEVKDFQRLVTANLKAQELTAQKAITDKAIADKAITDKAIADKIAAAAAVTATIADKVATIAAAKGITDKIAVALIEESVKACMG